MLVASFIGGGGRRRATAEEAADHMTKAWAVLMKLTKKLGWDDVHRYLGMAARRLARAVSALRQVWNAKEIDD